MKKTLFALAAAAALFAVAPLVHAGPTGYDERGDYGYERTTRPAQGRVVVTRTYLPILPPLPFLPAPPSVCVGEKRTVVYDQPQRTRRHYRDDDYRRSDY